MDYDIEFYRQLLSLGVLGGGEPRSADYVGTKALMLAVFEEGIRSYCGHPGEERTQAEAWIRSKSTSAFAFVTVCEILGFEPSAVRQALPQLQAKFLQPRRIRRQTGRRTRLGR